MSIKQSFYSLFIFTIILCTGAIMLTHVWPQYTIYILSFFLITLISSLLLLRHLLNHFLKPFNSIYRGVQGLKAPRRVLSKWRDIDQLSVLVNNLYKELRHKEKRLLRNFEKMEVSNLRYSDIISFINSSLRNKVASSLFQINLLSEGAYGPLSNEQRFAVHLIHDILHQINDTILTHMQVANIDSEDLAVNRTENSLIKDVVSPVCDDLKSMIDEMKINVSVNIPETLIIPFDRILMKVAIRNVIQTALKHCISGSTMIYNYHVTVAFRPV